MFPNKHCLTVLWIKALKDSLRQVERALDEDNCNDCIPDSFPKTNDRRTKFECKLMIYEMTHRDFGGNKATIHLFVKIYFLQGLTDSTGGSSLCLRHTSRTSSNLVDATKMSCRTIVGSLELRCRNLRCLNGRHISFDSTVCGSSHRV